MFSKYEKIEYPVIINGKVVNKILTDITTSLKISIDAVKNLGYFDRYIINDGDTPESIAYKAYGDVKKHYLIMLVNERFDYKNDWPLTISQLESICKEKYEDLRGVHHYENVITGEIITPIYDEKEPIRENRFKSVEDQVFVDPDHTILAEEIIPITNYEYEQALNEEKRHIIIIKKQFAGQIDAALQMLL